MKPPARKDAWRQVPQKENAPGHTPWVSQGPPESSAGSHRRCSRSRGRSRRAAGVLGFDVLLELVEVRLELSMVGGDRREVGLELGFGGLHAGVVVDCGLHGGMVGVE